MEEMINSRETLEVYDLYYTPLCSLTDDTLSSARNISEKHSMNTISSITFDIPLSSEKIGFIKNEALVKYKGEFYKIRVPRYSHSSDGTLSMTVECMHLSVSLEGIENDYIEEIGKSPEYLMKAVLGYPRNESGEFIVGAPYSGWKVGRVGVDMNKFRSLNVTESSIFSNLCAIAELYAGVLIFHSDTLTVDLVDDPIDRTEFPDRNIEIRHGKNLKSLDVSYDSSDLITEMAVFGGDAEDGSGAIHIMEYNPTGMSYLEDYSYYESQGYDRAYIDLHPELFYKKTVWNADDYVDALALYEDAVDKMAVVSQPKVSAGVNMANFSMFPDYFLENPVIGEYVDIIDEDLGSTIRARVISIDENSDNVEDFNITISNEIEYDSIIKNLVSSSGTVQKITTPKGETRASNLKGIIEVERANLMSTKSFWYTDPEDGGLIFENPEKTKALKLGAGVFGIAGNKVNGMYNFTSFGTGDGFTANQIVTGILRGSKVNWDLDNGTFLIGNSTSDYLMYFDGTSLHLNIEITYAQLDQTTQDKLADGVSAKALVTDISSDSKITPSEKVALLREWNNIASEKLEFVATASTYAITTVKTNYITAFDALAKFLNNNVTWTSGNPTLIADTTSTSNVVGATMQSLFTTYFQKRDALANAIYISARVLANNAQGTADTATTNILNMSLDSKLTPLEKINLSKEWASIVKEQTVILAQLDVYGNTVEKASLQSAYTALNNYLTPLFVNMALTSDITGSVLNGNFATYYESRATAYKAITDGAKGLIGTAQTTANEAKTNAGLAQGTADTAVANALTANNSIADIANDNKITPLEKSRTLLDWETIASEKTVIEAQAVSYAIVTEKATYLTAFTNLANYLNSGVAWVSGVPTMLANLTTTTVIVGTTFRSTFKAYYDAKITLLKVIAVKAKDLAGTAQSTADTAVTNASNAQAEINNMSSDSKFTPVEKKSLYGEWESIKKEKVQIDAQLDVYTLSKTALGTSYTTLSGIVTPLLVSLTTTSDVSATVLGNALANYYDNRAQAYKAISDASRSLANTAQGTANTAVTNAGLAQSKADSAFTNAGTANTAIADITSDSKLTGAEKPAVKLQWDTILSEKPTVIAQAGTYAIATTTYTNAFQALANYLNAGTVWASGTPSWLSDLTATTTIVGTTFRDTFKAYYDAKTSLLKLIADKAKELADNAQGTANTANGTANTAKGTADTALTNANNAKAKTDAWTYAGTTEISGTAIRTGTMTFEKAKGGTLTLGGSGANGGANGALSLKNASDVEIIKMNQEGITLSNGAKLISDGGVLSAFTFQSGGDLQGWQNLGVIDSGGSWFDNVATFGVFVPANLTITSAILYTRVASSYLTGMDWAGYADGYYGTSLLKLYKANSDVSGAVLVDGGTPWLSFGSSGKTDITTPAWGATTWSPTKGGTIQVKTSADIKAYLTAGARTNFVVESTDKVLSGYKASAVQFELVIIGYQKS